MVTTVVNGDLEVNYFVTGEYTVFGRFLNTFIDRLNKFLGDGAADGRVHELVALAGFLRFEVNFTVTVLTVTARLALEHTLGVYCLTDSFFISDLRFTYVRFNSEFAEKSVHDDFEVKFAHTCDNGLSGFGIGIGFEGGVFFREFRESKAHLFLSLFGLGFDSDSDNGLREFHLFEDYRIGFYAERVARGGFFKSDERADFSGIHRVHFFSVVSVHTKDTRDTFFLALGGVINVRTGFKNAGVRAEEREFTYERVGHDFERESAERSVVRRFAGDGVAVGIGSLYRADIERAGKIIHDSVQKVLNALVLIGRTAKNGSKFHGEGRFT